MILQVALKQETLHEFNEHRVCYMQSYMQDTLLIEKKKKILAPYPSLFILAFVDQTHVT